MPVDEQGFFDLYGDGRLTVIPLPGHTPGHQGLLVRLPKDGAMILSGDSVPCKENYRDFKIPRNHLDGEQARKTIQDLTRLRGFAGRLNRNPCKIKPGSQKVFTTGSN